MVQPAESETNFNDVRTWLRRAGKNAERCFICRSIWAASRDREGQIIPIRIASVEMTPDAQISHLARCVGGKTDTA